MQKKSQDWWEQQRDKMNQQVQEMHSLLSQLKHEKDPISRAAYETVQLQLEKINADLKRHLQHKIINRSLEIEKQPLDNIWS